ncbi:hypothetical protein ROZALSC1DRAFT_22910 [Rozella allomycis CSF55]|uniref:AN1-type domain-containing protein n=1 Tax=Rozella allomycis (strain CSF55) TaxID=988480 RepID=A0A4P9YGW5_ROZAC|nr:hypothetical protein ROZALSC1DRAFT_22910 [Rozella allomycis CSF55]
MELNIGKNCEHPFCNTLVLITEVLHLINAQVEPKYAHFVKSNRIEMPNVHFVMYRLMINTRHSKKTCSMDTCGIQSLVMASCKFCSKSYCLKHRDETIHGCKSFTAKQVANTSSEAIKLAREKLRFGKLNKRVEFMKMKMKAAVIKISD